jgi:hypothetical protein
MAAAYLEALEAVWASASMTNSQKKATVHIIMAQARPVGMRAGEKVCVGDLGQEFLQVAQTVRILVASGLDQPCSTLHHAIRALRLAAPPSKQFATLVKELTLLNRACTALDHFDHSKLKAITSEVAQALNGKFAAATEPGSELSGFSDEDSPRPLLGSGRTTTREVGVGTSTPIHAAVECFSFEEDGDSSSGAGEEPQILDCDAIVGEVGVSPPVVGEDLKGGNGGTAPKFGEKSLAGGQYLCGDFVDLSTAGGNDIHYDEGLSSHVPELGFLPLDTVGEALGFVELSTTDRLVLNWRPKPNFERRCAVEWQGVSSPVCELPYRKERGEHAARGGRSSTLDTWHAGADAAAGAMDGELPSISFCGHAADRAPPARPPCALLQCRGVQATWIPRRSIGAQAQAEVGGLGDSDSIGVKLLGCGNGGAAVGRTDEEDAEMPLRAAWANDGDELGEGPRRITEGLPKRPPWADVVADEFPEEATSAAASCSETQYQGGFSATSGKRKGRRKKREGATDEAKAGGCGSKLLQRHATAEACVKPADPFTPGFDDDATLAAVADEFARVLATCPEGQKAALIGWAERAPVRINLLRGECKAPPAAGVALRAGGRQERAAKTSCQGGVALIQRASDARSRSAEARHARAAALRAAPEQAQEGGEQAQEGGQAQVGGGVLGREPT